MKPLDIDWAGTPPSPPPPDRIPAAEQSFVAGSVDTAQGKVPRVSHEVTARDVLGRYAARWGIGRMSYAVTPGLYAFGSPTEESPVVVSCNYKLTFDLLRNTWKDLNIWVLVIETMGINVWCAAGKGTFGTDEIVRRIEASGLSRVVSHKNIILPQLGAPGVAAHEVKKKTGFKVHYGPVRAADLARYLADGRKADEEMRTVTFTLPERFVLTPMEVVGFKNHALKFILGALILSGIGPGIWTLASSLGRGPILILALVAGILAGGVLTPVLLPWLPGRMFSLKGAVTGIVTAAAILSALGKGLNGAEVASVILLTASIASYAAMNFTGATTFTSPSGVMKEMKRSLPLQIGALAVSLALWVTGAFL